MHPGRLIMQINVVQNYISDNFYFDHKIVRTNLTEIFFLTHTNKLKITISNSKKRSHYRIFTDFGNVFLRSPSNLCCEFSISTYYWTLSLIFQSKRWPIPVTYLSRTCHREKRFRVLKQTCYFWCQSVAPQQGVICLLVQTFSAWQSF